MTEHIDHRESRFFRELTEGWHRTATTGSEIWLQLCDRIVRVRFGDDRLKIPLSAAFSHARTDPRSQADLTILAGSGRQFRLPTMPFDASAFGRRCELATSAESAIEASFMMGPDILSMLNHSDKTAVYWIRNGDGVPGFEQAAPFRHLMHWFYRRNGWILVHGAAIGRAGSGLLICGKGGSGKSTLASSTWHNRDWQFAGDDYCAIRTDIPHDVASIYPTAKLSKDSAGMVKLQVSVSAPVEGEKSILFAHDHVSEQVPAQLRIVGLVLPKRTKQTAPPRALSPAAAARQLVVSTLYQMPHAGESDHRILSRIAHALPAWEVSVPEGEPGMALNTLAHLLKQSGSAIP